MSASRLRPPLSLVLLDERRPELKAAVARRFRNSGCRPRQISPGRGRRHSSKEITPKGITRKDNSDECQEEKKDKQETDVIERPFGDQSRPFAARRIHDIECPPSARRSCRPSWTRTSLYITVAQRPRLGASGALERKADRCSPGVWNWSWGAASWRIAAQQRRLCRLSQRPGSRSRRPNYPLSSLASRRDEILISSSSLHGLTPQSR